MIKSHCGRPTSSLAPHRCCSRWSLCCFSSHSLLGTSQGRNRQCSPMCHGQHVSPALNVTFWIAPVLVLPPVVPAKPRWCEKLCEGGERRDSLEVLSSPPCSSCQAWQNASLLLPTVVLAVVVRSCPVTALPLLLLFPAPCNSLLEMWSV